MFWLVFYNGSDQPEVEAAFSYPWLLCSYIDCVDRIADCSKFYHVFTPSGKVFPLKAFYKIHTNHKENVK